MKERFWSYFILELALTVGCLAGGLGERGNEVLVPFALLLACLLTARLLMQLLGAPRTLAWLACGLVCVALFAWSPAVLAPLATLLLLESLAEALDTHIAPQLALCALVGLLLLAVFSATATTALLTLAGLVLGSTIAVLTHRLAWERHRLLEKNGQLAALNTRIEQQRQVIGAIEQQGRAAERNRIAARIHDKIGHGVTGSILMLEAAQLAWQSDPELALSRVARATENLRTSVDAIRLDLRAERGQASAEQAGPAGISAELERFEREHPSLHCTLELNGMLDEVSQTIWLCVQDNLRETLTNLLRHSHSTALSVTISRRAGVVFVEFASRGRSLDASALNDPAAPITKGIGLAAIEERTLLAGGRCFFERRPEGFSTRMTFTSAGAAFAAGDLAAPVAVPAAVPAPAAATLAAPATHTAPFNQKENR
ncbi:MAG: histidine kinase [Coriobacteriales bacterium]|jgi:signal transduction histidine kinase|nr:histidine kinase [Coriobacteriales bacterium]